MKETTEQPYSKEFILTELERLSAMKDDVITGKLEGSIMKIKKEITYFEKQLKLTNKK